MPASRPDESDPPPHRGPVPAAAVVPPRARREPVPLEPQHLYKTAGLLFLFALLYRFFAEITVKLNRRGVHRSVTALENDIRAWIQHWNTDPRPYVWTRTADEILESLAAYCTRINDSGH